MFYAAFLGNAGQSVDVRGCLGQAAAHAHISILAQLDDMMPLFGTACISCNEGQAAVQHHVVPILLNYKADCWILLQSLDTPPLKFAPAVVEQTYGHRKALTEIR